MRPDALGHWQVWVASADLSEARQLTYENAYSGWPVWSPNGQKIAFESNRTDTNLNDEEDVDDVYLMNPDGSGVVDLTSSLGGTNGDAGWSPDGSLSPNR
jgi:Tol biopolymer transport system component